MDVSVTTTEGTSAVNEPADEFTFATPVGITAVGSLDSHTGEGLTTLTGVDPQHVGDLLVSVVEENDNIVTVTSVSGGGVTTWNRAIQYVGTMEPREYEIWYGVVTTTGSTSITYTLSGSIGSQVSEYEAQEFTTSLGAGTTWSVDTTGSQENTSSTTVTYPSLTPTAAGDLYYGFVDLPNPPLAGTTPGFVGNYSTTADANQVTYDPDCGSGSVQPTASQSSAAGTSALAALFVAHAPAAAAPTVTGVSPPRPAPRPGAPP